MMSPHRLAALLFAVLLPAFSLLPTGALAQTTVTSDPPASFTLPNGLQVVVVLHHEQPAVSMR
ncbi:MAG TPA: insulinase family protein, partial [Bradyrhizobium sp.]|nr:insulinase family protein [Bradyrhizobium sp.]